MRKYIILLASAFLTGSISCGPGLAPSTLDFKLFETGSELSAKEIDRRIQVLERILSDDPDNFRLHHSLAVYYRMKSTPYSRSRAISEINRAISLNRREPGLYMEKGRIDMDRGFFGDAELSLRKALEIEPCNYEAFFRLGLMKRNEYVRNMCFPGRAEEAAEFFSRAVGIDSTVLEGSVELATLNLLLGRVGRARILAELLKKCHNESPVPYTLMGIIHLRNKKFRESETEFARALELMPPSEKKDYIDIGLFLPGEELNRFSALPENWKRNYRRGFWISRDPTPATETNERVLEHYSRVYLARYLFSNNRLGYSGPDTDRGRSLIRYGMPDSIYIPFGQWRIESTDASIIAWEYVRGKAGFKLYFMDEFLNGDYHIPIDSGLAAYSEVNRVIELYNPENYSYPLRYRNLSLSASLIQKKGNKGRTALYISASLPVEDIAPGGPAGLIYLIRDSNSNNIYSHTLAFSPESLRVIRRGSESFFVLRRKVELMPRIGISTFHVSCVDSTEPARGTYSSSFYFTDFSARRLLISDIALSLSPYGKICSVWPDGLSAFPRGGYLCLAYDIYNLQLNNRSESDYRLTYTIIPAIERAEGFVSSLLERIGKIAGSDGGTAFTSNTLSLNSYSSSVSDRLIIDTGSLESGNYTLRLEVTDLINGNTARSESEFTLKTFR